MQLHHNNKMVTRHYLVLDPIFSPTAMTGRLIPIFLTGTVSLQLSEIVLASPATDPCSL